MSTVLDHGYCRLIESWGSDERVIESARMSTSGSFRGWGPIEFPCTFTHDEGVWPCPGCYDTGVVHRQGDEKLLEFLWKNGHTSPFEMAGATFEVQCPMFVARQWMRHRTLSYNELSARYTEMPEMFYLPSIERLMAGGQSKSNKQASGAPIDEQTARGMRGIIEIACESALADYNRLLDGGLSRELARSVLPVNWYTRFRVSGNLWNWCRFESKRLPGDAQWEIRQYAEVVQRDLASVFSRTMALFAEGVSK